MIAGSLCMGNISISLKFSCSVTLPAQGLNFFVVHQRTAGLPREIHKVFAFCFLPSRQTAILCHQMGQVPVCGMRRSRFREGKSHGLFLNIHTCENPVLWPCSAGKNVKFTGPSFDIPRTPGARFKVQLQWSCWNDLGSPLSGMWGRPCFKFWTCRIHFSIHSIPSRRSSGCNPWLCWIHARDTFVIVKHPCLMLDSACLEVWPCSLLKFRFTLNRIEPSEIAEMFNFLNSCPAAVSPEITSGASPSHSARMSLMFAVTRNVARAAGSSRSTRA